jgi:quercetin dioxygenase-like cupin family protein
MRRAASPRSTRESPLDDARFVATVALLVCVSLSTIRSDSEPSWLAAICSVLPSQEADSAMINAGRPATSVHPLSCEPLPNAPGKSVTTVIVDFPPHAFTGPHRHPGSVTAYVIAGVVRSQMEGAPAADYRSGQTWFEAPYALHALAENPDPVHPAKLLATFVTDSACGPLVLPP